MSNIKVAVRIRPISEREVSVTGSEIVVHTDGNELLLTNLKVSASKAGDSRKRTRRYGFDYCFNSSILDSEVQGSQERVYDILGKSALDAIFSGFNACLVAYGQSASGKTYTMMGPKNDPGLTPRLCEGLFLRIFDEEKNAGQRYETVVSYLEIYNERVRDLLKPSSSNSGSLRVREHPRLGPYVQGLTRHTVSTLGSLMSYVEEGTRARKTASTSQNLTSSRSHALLTVSLASRADNSGGTVSTASTGLEKKQQLAGRGARLHLVDLAGSERAGNSNYGLHRLKEGANINKSLVALGNVISALAERGATGSGPGRRFIPYRDSALTWLLKDALGGNATTIMLATISPASGSYNETAHTLRFAQRAQSVVNRPVVNEDPVARVIRELQAEIARLTSLLSEKQETVPIENLSCCCTKQFRRDSEEESCAQVNRVVEKTVESINRSHEFTRSVSAVSPLHRRYSSDDSLSSSKLTNEKVPVISLRRFGSLRSLESEEDAVFRNSDDAVKLSTVNSYDRVSSLALVDIPTLVAVLIKPEGDPTSSAQIEEISSENILEETAIEDPEELDPSEFDDREKTTASIVDYSKLGEDLEGSKFRSKEASVLCLKNQVEKNSVKPNGIEAATHKKSSSLNGSKKFGSSESFDSLKKTETPYTGLGRRSYTNLQLERTDKNGKHANPVANLSKSKRTWGSRGPTAWALPRKSDAGDKEKDTVKDGATDSEKSSKDLGQQKARTSLKKQDSDSPKRKFSRDGIPGIPKDELTGPLGAPKLVRKGSVPGEVSWRTQTPIHRSNRRAEIVAAVTERLYSTKKATEEVSTTPSSSSLVPEFRSPESTEVKLANTTRMKLQEISRKMLAKRRKTCADTQTDVASTVRVKDAASITENPEIETKDASVITDVHEECLQATFEGGESSRVIRVKEIATLTEKFAKTTIRCVDAEVLTDDWEEEGGSVSSSNTAINPETDKPRLVESSTNTTWLSDNGRSSSSQTVPDDILPDCKKGHNRDCDVCHSVRNCCYQPLALGHSDRSVICITLPDMLSITIESPNPLESKIAVSEGLDDKVRVKLKDGETQTEQEILELTNLCSDVTESEKLDDLSMVVTTRSTSCQSDGRTFRIENIFKDQKPKTQSTSELLPDLTEHVVSKTSLKLTNSVGTFFGPETSERSTEIEGFNFFDHKMRGANEKSKMFSQITNIPCRGADPSRLESCYEGVQLTNNRSNFELQPQPHLKQEPVVGVKSASIPRYPNYGEGRPSVPLKSSAVARIQTEDLKSPVLVARLIASGSCNMEMDSSFSDDSLDPEDVIPHNSVSKQSASSRLDDSLCPPDVVAHTKKDQIYDSHLEDDFADEVIEFPKTRVGMPDPQNAPRVHDYESLVLGRNCFLPASASQDSGGSNSSRMETPESEEGRNPFKKKVSFSNSQPPDRLRVKDPRKPKPIIKNKLANITHSERYLENKENHVVEVKERCSNYSRKTEKLRVSSTPLECSTSENSFRDDDISSISGSSETIRSGAMYNSDEDSDVNSTQRSGEDSDTKRVRFTTLLFGDLVESGTSDSEGCCEAAVSDDDNFSCDIKTEDFTNRVFASYLDEATAFVHNMNTVNDYVNASKLFQEQNEYIEYEGCRISLRDDTEDYLKDQKFSVPLDSYNSCLRGIEKLENCIERAVKHDKYLIDKYGIHLESAATSFSLVDPGKDSINNFHTLNQSFQNPDELDSTSSIEDMTVVTDENSSGIKERDIESRIYDQLMSPSAPRRRSILRVNKPYFRRSTRMSDLTGTKSPISWSRFRKKNFTDFDSGFLSPGDLPQHEWLGTSDSGSPQSNSEELVDETRELKAPKCFLVVPEPGKSISSGKELYGSDGGTSSSEAVATSSESIDTVASVRNKFRYPGSPRAKLLQLVSERRQIVHRSRSGNSPG